MRNDWGHRLRAVAFVALPPLIALIAIFALWELYISWRDVSILVLPAPSDAIQRFFEDPGFYWREAGYTLYEATLGLLLGSAVALACAVLMAHSRVAERTIFPLAILIKVTPLVAVVPMLVIIFGFGIAPKIIVAGLFSFFPMLVNAMTGFRDINAQARDFLASLRASTWQIFWKLRLPGAMPYLFAGLKVAYPLALTGAVVAEYFTGDRGLGVTIFRANANLNTPTLFAACGVLAISGVAINVFISVIERRVLFWHESVRSTD
ncbi:MAG: ABC transporter permease [Chloroflexi bacterium]|nr:MAG: ABC transporter permease [Chloroflexota bacterium]